MFGYYSLSMCLLSTFHIIDECVFGYYPLSTCLLSTFHIIDECVFDTCLSLRVNQT